MTKYAYMWYEISQSCSPCRHVDVDCSSIPNLDPPTMDEFFKGQTGQSTRTVLRLVILLTVAAAAVSSRLFSVIRFESIIHECE